MHIVCAILFLMNKLNIHRKFLQLVFVITSDQMVDIIVAALTFDAFLSLKGENGDQKIILVPIGTKVPKWGPTWEQCSGVAILQTSVKHFRKGKIELVSKQFYIQLVKVL